LRKAIFPAEFVFEQPQTAGAETVLYQEHIRLTDKSHIVDFAGFLMPLWYSSISTEHTAVRQKAGIFDCTHMGVLEIAGADAADFLDLITTNDINSLAAGCAQYSYILDAAGNVLDDIIVYRRSADKFMMVVNAANTPKIKAYLEALKNNRIVIDPDNPGRKLKYKSVIRDMKISDSKADCRVDIALQGPAATDIIFSLIENNRIREEIKNLKPFHFIEADLTVIPAKAGIYGDIDCIISRTGYTGAKIGFELFVHPVKAPQLWNILLEKGSPLGLVPCGLGARDSLRIEAGLPLYGHELAGPFNISPFEAGYGWAVKLEKEFFIGKTAMQHRVKTYDMKVAQIELRGEKGIRPVRQNDGVLNKNGECIGWTLSCANAGEKQVALVYVNKESAKENDPVGVYYLARSQIQIQQGKLQSVRKGQNLQPCITGTVVNRFAKF
jgi:glycine hydroxymethyltransferase